MGSMIFLQCFVEIGSIVRVLEGPHHPVWAWSLDNIELRAVRRRFNETAEIAGGTASDYDECSLAYLRCGRHTCHTPEFVR